MAEHYDVIIIGIGSGRRHACPQAGAEREADPAARARRLSAARARELGLQGGLWQGPLRLRGDVDRQERRDVFAPRPVLRRAATRRSTARSCFACASATSARCATTAVSRRRGRCPMRTSSPTTPRPSASISCTAQAGEDHTEPPRSGPFPHPPVSHEPRIHQLADDFERAGLHPVSPAGRASTSTSQTPRRGAACAATASTAFRASPTASQTPTSVACARRCRAREPDAPHPRQGRAPGDRRLRADGHQGRRRPGRLARGVQRRHRGVLLRRDQLGGACCCARHRSVTRDGLGQLLRSGRGATTWRTSTPRVIAVSQTRQPDDISEDAWGQRLLLGRPGLRAAARAHPDARQVRSQHPARRGAVVRAAARARLPRPARDRLLADDRGPAADRENRVTVDREGRIHLAKTYANQEPHRRLLGQAQGSARAAGLPRDGDSRASRCSTSRSRSPASPTPAGPHASGPIRPNRCSTSTARLTTSTTSTSSTRASSRPRARSTPRSRRWRTPSGSAITSWSGSARRAFGVATS